MRSPPSLGGGGGGGSTSDHYSTSGGNSWMSSLHPQSTNRQVISSPLATLSMTSSLEDGVCGGSSLGQSALCRPAAKRKPENGGEQENGMMESDSETPSLHMMQETLSTELKKDYSNTLNQTMS